MTRLYIDPVRASPPPPLDGSYPDKRGLLSALGFSRSLPKGIPGNIIDRWVFGPGCGHQGIRVFRERRVLEVMGRRRRVDLCRVRGVLCRRPRRSIDHDARALRLAGLLARAVFVYGYAGFFLLRRALFFS